MRIDERLRGEKPSLSFEVFPPKPDSDPEPIFEAAREIAALSPDYMSVTYGAGGGNAKNTAELALALQREGVTALAHLTCIGSTRESILGRLRSLKDAGIENVLALRGDRPADMPPDGAGEYTYASELVRDIKAFGGFCVGAACYPEGHTECASREEDIRNLKIKVESGCDFLTTQMFFDNSVLYSFLYRLREQGITLPVVAGVMPVTNARQIARTCALCGASLPSRFRLMADKFGSHPAAMKQAGIAYATEQIIDLFANGIRAVHVYVMNKPDVASAICRNLSEILR